MTGKPTETHRRSRQRAFAGLTELENRFVDEYVIDMDAQNALIRAGYKSKHPAQDAYKLRRKTHISDAIAKRMIHRSNATGIDAKFVLIEAAYQYQEASQRAASNPSERRNALKALEMVGKHVDILAFRNQIGVGDLDGNSYDYSRLSDLQLDQLERILEIAAGIEQPPQISRDEEI